MTEEGLASFCQPFFLVKDVTANILLVNDEAIEDV